MTVEILIVWRRFGVREGDHQPQRDVLVAEHETGRVQARHDLAAERSADKVRWPALGGARKHGEGEQPQSNGTAL